MDNETTNPVTLAEFGTSFQEKLVKIIIKDRTFADQIQEVLKVDYIDSPHLRVLVSKIFAYKEKYKEHPSASALKSIFVTELKGEPESIRDKIKEFFVNIISKEPENNRDEGYVKDKSLDFCKKQVLKDAMVKAVDCLERSSFDEISVLINEALKLGADTNFGHDYLKDFEDRFKIKLRHPVSTSLAELDAIMQNGLGRGELGIVIAPVGVGKSMLLVFLGAAALRLGKNVVHYTLELGDHHVGLRYDACLSGIEINNLKENKQLVYDTIKNVPGKLIIKEFPTKTASTRTLRTHLDKLIMRGFQPDLVIVDYGDILRPISTYKEKRFELENIYEELRAMAQQYQIPLWSATQTNRGGLNQEIITMESISEAFNKTFVADFIFSLSRTMDDKNANTGKIFICKNRMGRDGLVIPIYIDTATVKIKILNANEMVEEKKSLSDKYKEHLSEKKKNENKN